MKSLVIFILWVLSLLLISCSVDTITKPEPPPEVCEEWVEQVIDFEGFPAGDIASGVVTTANIVTIEGVRDGEPSNQAMIFNTDNPTGGDDDLSAGTGNVLIISEDGDQLDPDDNDGGGELIFSFDDPISVESLDIIDNEEDGSEIVFLYEDGTTASAALPTLQDGELRTLQFSLWGVTGLIVKFKGSGAVDNISFSQLVTINCE